MANPQLGFAELEAGQAQPEVTVNGALRAITQAIADEIAIDLEADEDYELGDDEWPYGVIRITDQGTVLSMGRAVIYPDVDTLVGGTSRMRFMFVNETAQTLTLKRSGETGVAVASGDTAFVWHNGTDIAAIVNPLPT